MVTVRVVFLFNGMAFGFKREAQILVLHFGMLIISIVSNYGGVGDMPHPVGAYPPGALRVYWLVGAGIQKAYVNQWFRSAK